MSELREAVTALQRQVREVQMQAWADGREDLLKDITALVDQVRDLAGKVGGDLNAI